MNQIPSNNATSASAATLKIVLIYFVFSAVWILFSDELLQFLFNDSYQIMLASIIKGWLFVVITSVLLYGLVNRLLHDVLESSSKEQLVQTEKLRALQLLEAIAENSPDVIFAKDMQGRHLLFNREAARLTGKPAEDVLGRDDTFLFPPEQAAALMANDKQVMDENRIITFLDHLSTVDGDLVYLATKGPLHDGEGKVIGIFGISRNITERKHIEDALRMSEKRFHDLVEVSADWIWEVDAGGRYTYVSEGVQKLLGYTAEEVLGKTAFDLMPPDEAARMAAEFAAFAARCEPFRDLDNITLHQDGSPRHVQTSGTPLLDETGNLLGYRGLDRDVTALKLAEAELRKLTQAVEQSPVSIFVTDLHGCIVYVNQEFVRNSGYGREEAIGKNSSFLASGKTPRATFKALWETLQREHVWQGEFINRRKDGSEHIEHATIAPVRDEQGRVTHYLSVQQDVTLQKQAEAEIHRLAHYDGLTGLPNRTLLQERLGQMLALSGREMRQGALLLFDIDRQDLERRAWPCRWRCLAAVIERTSGPGAAQWKYLGTAGRRRIRDPAARDGAATRGREPPCPCTGRKNSCGDAAAVQHHGWRGQPDREHRRDPVSGWLGGHDRRYFASGRHRAQSRKVERGQPDGFFRGGYGADGGTAIPDRAGVASWHSGR
jgi:PAS domain S-box-containing protein